MKKLISLIICAAMLVGACGVCRSEDKTSYTDIFKKDNVIDVNIEISDEDLQDMYDYAQNEEYHSADITVDGVKVENAGIRTKGNMTLNSVSRSDSDRYSFRIKFDKYVKGQTLLGMDELCLNNQYSDPSYMREYLHYEMLKELGMNVPEVSYCNVYINGELSGFYLAVEGLDDAFLEREFGEDYKDGNFYKMDEGSTLEYKEDENYTYADLKSGDDTDLTEFKNFVKKLNSVKDGEKGDIESFLDVDSALKYIASNTVLCNYDSYNGNRHHNFYLYENADGVFTVVPWDFNMSFGGFNGNNSTVGIDTPYISGSSETLPLIGKLLSIDEYKEKYYGYIKEMMNTLENFEDRVTELKKIIKPYVEKDPTAFYSVDDFEKATSASSDNTAAPSKGGMGGNSSIVSCISDRLDNLKKQFSGEAKKTTEANNFGGRGDRGNGGGKRDDRPQRQDGGQAPPDQDGGFNPNGQAPPDQDGGFNPGGQTPPDQDGGFNPGGQTPPDQDVGFNPGGQTPPDQNGGFNPNGQAPPDQDGDFNPNGQMPSEKNNKIRVHLNGHILSFEQDPIIENDTTLVGYRTIMEALGAEVTWDADTKTVTAVKDGTTVKLTIGSDKAYVNGEEKELSASPRIMSDTTVVPLRFISEQLNMKVSWDGDAKLITVNSPKS